MQTTLRIEGMHCGSCKVLIEDVSRDIAGVQSCDVNVEQKTAVIEHTPELDISKVIQEISGLGDYRVTKV